MRFTTNGGCHVDRSAERAGARSDVLGIRLAVGVITVNDSPVGADETRGGLPVAAASGTAEETGRTLAYAITGKSGTPSVAGVTGGESAAIPFEPRPDPSPPPAAQPETNHPLPVSGAYSPWSVRPGSTSFRSTYP